MAIDKRAWRTPPKHGGSSAEVDGIDLHTIFAGPAFGRVAAAVLARAEQ